MHIADSVHIIVNTFNECMYQEIGDQDGYYDRSIWVFIDRYYAYEEAGYPTNDTFDWIEAGKQALIQTRDVITADDHPSGPLKARHKLEVLHNLSTALTSLKMLKYPNYIPVLDRVAVRVGG